MLILPKRPKRSKRSKRRARRRDVIGDAQLRPLARRMVGAGLWVLATGIIGAAGYRALSGGEWSWSDTLYMTVLTISTVGFAEVLPDMANVPYARLWTVILILFGSAGLLTFISSFTAFIVENDLGEALARSRMMRRIDELKDHCVVCGCGSTGEYVVKELIRIGTPFVVIDKDIEKLDNLDRELDGILYIVGDATTDEMLLEAGIKRAQAVVAALHDDPDNLYVTLSARTLAPDIRIVTRGIEEGARRKMELAGADSVVLSNVMGGTRMAQEMVRPKVVQFLDQMLREQELDLEELTLEPGHPLIGTSLARADLRSRGNALVVAVRSQAGTFTYNPTSDHVFLEGSTLILIAPRVRAKSSGGRS